MRDLWADIQFVSVAGTGSAALDGEKMAPVPELRPSDLGHACAERIARLELVMVDWFYPRGPKNSQKILVIDST